MSDDYAKASGAQTPWYPNQSAKPIGDDLRDQMIRQMAHQQSMQQQGLGQSSANVPRPETALEGIARRLAEVTSQLSQLGARLDLTITRATGTSAIGPQQTAPGSQGQVQGPQPTLHAVASLFDRISDQIGGLQVMADHVERLG